MFFFNIVSLPSIDDDSVSATLALEGNAVSDYATQADENLDANVER